jgi:hypothetical protein
VQLDLLAMYCERTAFDSYTTKTKVLLLAGAQRAAVAVANAQAADLAFVGVQLEVLSSFRYLGIMFEVGQPLTAAVTPARRRAARAAQATSGARRYQAVQKCGQCSCSRQHPRRHVWGRAH